LFAVELAEGGEVQVVGDLELAGLEQEEGGDQIWVAADDAELAAELLLSVGYGAGTPSPLPVREAAVETVPNHEDVGSSEHQSRLSKGVIAKVVQSLKLWACFGATQTRKPPQWWLFDFFVYVTEAVSISRVANRVGINGRFLASIPDVGVTSAQSVRGLPAWHEVSLARN
jgi:hypothetical protein